jgi:hypothetical protein
MNIYEKLSNIQNELKCNKNQFNKFGGYKYRSCEDILEAVKPICKKYKTVLILCDDLQNIGDRYYIEAKASLVDIEASDNSLVHIINTAYAREEESKKGMDGSQITGTASSYARKYALNGLFNIDDTKDADTDEYTRQTLDEDKKITKTQVDALYELIKNRAVEKDTVLATLKEKGYDKLADIKNKDYMNIVKQFERFVIE